MTASRMPGPGWPDANRPDTGWPEANRPDPHKPDEGCLMVLREWTYVDRTKEASVARRYGRRGRKVRVQPAGRSWIRITPKAQQKKESWRGILPPRIKRLMRGFIYHR